LRTRACFCDSSGIVDRFDVDDVSINSNGCFGVFARWF
jgi:hypothetical protein